MDIARIDKIKTFKNRLVKLNGWVYNSRSSGKIGFLMLRDGFGIIQCIISKSDIGDNNFKQFKKLTQESSLSIVGNVVENERAPGGFEIIVSKIELLQLSNDYPISSKFEIRDINMDSIFKKPQPVCGLDQAKLVMSKNICQRQILCLQINRYSKIPSKSLRLSKKGLSLTVQYARKNSYIPIT